MNSQLKQLLTLTTSIFVFVYQYLLLLLVYAFIIKLTVKKIIDFNDTLLNIKQQITSLNYFKKYFIKMLLNCF